ADVRNPLEEFRETDYEVL
nr:RecName: Full=L-amino-acid oxidase; Short=Balt-LAAO-I; Short=LAO [Bothrops alternatus]